MKLVEFTIKNYKSLREVKLEFGNYTALIGENGSGKTSILEALYLFFKDFNAVGGDPSSILLEDASWYNKNLPLEFKAKILLEEKECSDVFPKDVLSEVIENNVGTLSILRQIPEPGESWKTGDMRIGKVSLVEDNTLVSTDELTKAISKTTPKRKPEQFKVFLFDPNANQSNLIGDRLIVLDSIAYYMDDYTDGLVRDGKIQFEHLPGEEHRAWAEGKGLKLVENPPTKEEVDMFLSGKVTLNDDQVLQYLQNKMTEKIKGKMKLIQATRNEKVEPGERAAFLSEHAIINPLTSLDKTDFEAWYEIETAVEKLTGQRLHSVPTLSAREGNLRLPIHLIGGGQQEIIGLLYQIHTASEPIIAIEEPETHLHHNLSRELFKLLKEVVAGKQLIVATHSEYFAEISGSSKNWFLEKKTRETKLKEMITEPQRQEYFGFMGAEPSDRGYPNKILFVAGGTEEGVLPVWAGRLRLNIDKVRIEPLEGEYDHRKIKIINKYISDAQTPVFLMVDSHAKEEVKQTVDEDHRLIVEGTTEDCYPIPILVQVLNKRFELTLEEDDIDPEKPRVEEIKRVLKEKAGYTRKNDFWKRSLGREVAKQMSKDDIPEEIIDFMIKVAAEG